MFQLEIGRNAISGISAAALAGSSPSIGESFQTLWDASGDFIYPTTGETWELLSDNVNDTLLGTGARTVLISGLNDSYIETVEIKDLDGTTPVLTTTTSWFRVYEILVISSGSSQFNEGTITLRASGGGAIRSQILPTISESFNGFFTVPAGKTFFVLSATPFIPKGEDVTIINRVMVFGTNTWISGSESNMYQNSTPVIFQALPVIPEKSDIEARVKSSNPSVRATLNIDGNLVNTTNLSMFMGGL